MALSLDRKKEILETVSHLRVTDVRDGMDWVGRHHFGTVSPDIRPLWRTKAAGFALTMRHIPTQQQVPTMTPQDYTKWAYELKTAVNVRQVVQRAFEIASAEPAGPVYLMGAREPLEERVERRAEPPRHRGRGPHSREYSTGGGG